MSLETKIRELMEAKKAKAQQLDEALGQEGTVQQGSSEKATYTEIDPRGALLPSSEAELRFRRPRDKAAERSSRRSYSKMRSKAAHRPNPSKAIPAR